MDRRDEGYDRLVDWREWIIYWYRSEDMGLDRIRWFYSEGCDGKIDDDKIWGDNRNFRKKNLWSKKKLGRKGMIFNG